MGDLYDDVGLLPGSRVAGCSKGDSGSKDMFSRNEKWIGNPPQSVIRLGSLVKKKFWVEVFISRNFQVGPHKGRLSLERRSSKVVDG